MIRENKIKKLKSNVEIATERAIRQKQRSEKRELNQLEKDHFRKEFEKSAERIHRTKLHEVFNR